MGGDGERRGDDTTRRGKSQRAISDALYARRKALADLMRSPALRDGDVARAVRQITETAADLLEVERASVWRLTDGGQALVCVDLFERTAGRHGGGARILATDVPRYFEALRRERSLAALDARLDERTSEFTASYLEPNGIAAMLDAPIFVRGQMIGVICHEHVGAPRSWEFFEELLAGTFADFVALVIETADWRRAEDALRVERDQLELRVAARTRELRDSEADLREQAHHDGLTGLFNRRRLDEVVRSELERARRYGRPLSVALLDADHFKQVNDGHGHQVGDEVLRGLAARCGGAVRTSDVLGRYGGEEFLVVFPETGPGEATVVAERMRRAVAGAPMQIGALALSVTASIGVAALRPDEDALDLIARADAALYAAKQAGRNRVAVAPGDAAPATPTTTVRARA